VRNMVREISRALEAEGGGSWTLTWATTPFTFLPPSFFPSLSPSLPPMTYLFDEGDFAHGQDDPGASP
jgi:hypothetical protein